MNAMTNDKKRTIIDLISDEEEEKVVERKPSRVSIHRVEGKGKRWQPFYLTTVQGIATSSNENCLSFADLFSYESGNDIEEVCLMNYMIDLEWIIDQVPHLLLCEKLLCLHGSTLEDCYQRDSWIVSKVDMGIERYGTHHSKIAIIFYKQGMRLVITTANFYSEDFDYRTQGVYIQDFPLKTHSSNATHFEIELIDYLSRVSASTKAERRLEQIRRRIEQYDFTSAQVTLIASVPGRHTGVNKEKWGIGKLHRELQIAGLLTSEYDDYSLVMQFSSIGSMGKDGKIIDELAMRMVKPTTAVDISSSFTKASTAPSSSSSSSSSHHSTSSSPGHYDARKVELVWPTVECVRLSLQVSQEGGSDAFCK
jgi:hypothetical protein